MGKLTIRETNIFYLLFMMAYFELSVAVGMMLPENVPAWIEFCVSDAILILPVAVLFLVKKINPLKVLEFAPIGVMDILLSYFAAYCLMPMIYFISTITMFFAKNYVGDMMAEVFEYPLAVQLILLALLPAVVEETLSRGVFYGSYRRRNVLRGALMSGLLFGLMHLNLNQFAYAFFMGVVFCVLYEVSGNILLPMTTHFAVNAHSVLTQWVSSVNAKQAVDVTMANSLADIPLGDIIVVLSLLLGMGVLGMGLFVAIVKYIARRHNRLEVLQNAWSNRKQYKEEASGRFLDIYMIAAIVPAVLYMISLEILGM